MTRRRLLIVEDEVGIAESLTYLLEQEHFAVAHVASLAEARAALAVPVEMVILDLGLPDGNGMDLLRQLRAEGSTPVIVLTSRDGEVDTIVGLELGADDYISKPFSAREVVARVKAVLRRGGAEAAPAAVAAVRLDGDKRRAWWGDAEMPLTKLEFDLLAALSGRPGHVFSRSHLLDRVWGDDVAVTDRTVDAHIKSLRRKIREAGGDGDVVETVRGVGYRMRE